MLYCLPSVSSILLAGKDPSSILKSVGFGDIWDDDGGQGFSRWIPMILETAPFLAHMKVGFMWTVRFALLCASSESCPADLAARLPPPGELIEMERRPVCQSMFCGPLWPGASALLKLGEVDRAVELAKVGIEESKNALVRVGSHRVLAEAAHARQDAGGAERAFRAAHEEARSRGLNYLALLCARDLKKKVLDGDGRGAEGDAMIDGACEAMGKEREEFAGIL